MEQIEQEEEKIVNVPLATKLGMVVLPMVPTLVIDALFHGGLTVPALTAFGLSYLSFEGSPKAIAWLGENKQFLAWLAERPETLRKVDRLTRNYFSQQLVIHHLAASVQPKDVMQTVDNGDGPEIPHAPAFAQMSHLISGERLILCYDAKGPVYGTIADLLSMAVAGKPGRGKTTALMYYVAILLKAGAEITIWDPHGAMAELSALNGLRLQNMPATAKITYLTDVEEMYVSVDVLQQDLEERNLLYKRHNHQTKHPHLLLADELPILAAHDKKLKRQDDGLIYTFQRFVLEARKWQGYFIGSSQTFSAQVLPTDIRDALSSRIVFFSSGARARMAGLENEAIERYLPLLRRAQSGVMVFDCSRFDDPILAAIPYITVTDLINFLGLPASAVQLPAKKDVEIAPEPRVVTQSTAQEQPTMRQRASEPRTAAQSRIVVRVPEGSANERRMAREKRLREGYAGEPKQSAVKQDEHALREQDQSPEDSLTADERRVLNAYREGHRTGNAIAGIIGMPGTRVNQCLNKLSALRIIDWQPKVKS